MTKLLIDEMFPPETAVIPPTSYEHDAVHVSEVGLRAVDDSLVAAAARVEGRALVTENGADFAAERDVILDEFVEVGHSGRGPRGHDRH